MGYLGWVDAEGADDRGGFPPSRYALQDPNGLLAAGGDLSPSRLLTAYKQGIFPWFEAGQPILWWTPDPRTVLFPAEFHVSRSLRKVIRQEKFELTADEAFSDVISACAGPRDGVAGTWLTPDMQSAYCELHAMGFAHSVEAWQDGELAGGIYGIALGAVFFGESMFSHKRDASKVAFATLARKLHHWGYALIDCQVASAHLFSLGAREIPRSEFESLLRTAVGRDPGPSNWREAWRD